MLCPSISSLWQGSTLPVAPDDVPHVTGARAGWLEDVKEANERDHLAYWPPPPPACQNLLFMLVLHMPRQIRAFVHISSHVHSQLVFEGPP